MTKFLKKAKPIVCFILCIIICITVIIISSLKDENGIAKEERFVLKVWQIDSFEGGKGSRADYLQTTGDEYSKESSVYFSVTSVSADAARRNIANGNVPDIISYGAGFYGLESYIGKFTCWCYGGYCLLSLDSNADFSDCSGENTVVNIGKDNRSDIAATFLGLYDADYEKPTTAYVKLINGNYKYMLGTQRDVFRLKTRGVSFKLKPITEFNDLYQNVSVLASGKRGEESEKFIKYIISKSAGINKLGLFASGQKLYDNELKDMECLAYNYKIISPISKSTKDKIDSAVNAKDINSLKNLMK